MPSKSTSSTNNQAAAAQPKARRRKSPFPAGLRPCEDIACTAPAEGPYARFCKPCAAKRRRKTPKYLWTAERDATLRDVYRSDRLGVKAVATAASRIGFPRWVVKARAMLLGLTRVREKEPPWSDAELEILARHAWKGPQRIRLALKAAGFARTNTAIQVKRKRLQLAADGYSLNEIAELLGVDSHKVARWVRQSLLPARRRGQARTAKQGGDAWYVAHASLSEFLRKHLPEVSLRRADEEWLKGELSALLAGPMSGETLSVEEERIAKRERIAERSGFAEREPTVTLAPEQAAAVSRTAESLADAASALSGEAWRAGVSEARLQRMLTRPGEQTLDWVLGALALAGWCVRLEKVESQPASLEVVPPLPKAIPFNRPFSEKAPAFVTPRPARRSTRVAS